VAANEVRLALTSSFMQEIDLTEAGQQRRQTVQRVGQLGITARAVVFALIGWFFLRAAWRAAPDQVGGLKDALNTLASAPLGQWLLALVAVGLIAYGLYCGVLAVPCDSFGRGVNCTDLLQTPMQILDIFVQRWQLEIIFEEVRAQLGVKFSASSPTWPLPQQPQRCWECSDSSSSWPTNAGGARNPGSVVPLGTTDPAQLRGAQRRSWANLMEYADFPHVCATTRNGSRRARFYQAPCRRTLLRHLTLLNGQSQAKTEHCQKSSVPEILQFSVRSAKYCPARFSSAESIDGFRQAAC